MPEGTELPRAAGTVLIVAADHDLGDLLQRSLAAIGLRTDRALTGVQGLAALARFSPALLLLDLGLPDMHGEAVATAARRRYGEGLPIIVLSDRVHGNPYLPPVRAAAVLPPPFDQETLLRTVRRCLR